MIVQHENVTYDFRSDCVEKILDLRIPNALNDNYFTKVVSWVRRKYTSVEMTVLVS